MAVGNVKGFRVKKGNETGIAKIATEAYLDESVTKAKLAQAVQDTLDDVENKADQDGDYDSLTAGGAKQLLSTVYVDDNEPYNFRTAGGSADIGDRMYEEVVGGSIVWNQLIDGVTNTTTVSGITFTKTDDHTITASGMATARVSLRMNRLSLIAVEPNHVYCVRGMEQNSQNIALIFNGFSESGSYVTTYTNTYNGNGFVLKNTRENVKKVNIECTIPNGTELSKSYIIQPQLIDLTQMFGSTIADYIYSLEQGTAGAGVAWFRKLFPKPYYEYNAGELMSVKAGSHDTVGFNAFDKSTAVANYYISNNDGELKSSSGAICTDFIRIVPNAVYNITSEQNGGMWGAWYDADKNFVGGFANYSALHTAPSNACYMRCTVKSGSSTGNVDTFCVNLSWDGERKGEYEPYVKHEYPLEHLELRGIPKLDANNQLYYDGDTYASDGTVTRKYGIVDLGTVTWMKSSKGTGNFYTNNTAAIGVRYAAGQNVGFLCTKYALGAPSHGSGGYYPTQDKTFNYWWKEDVSSINEFYFHDESADSMTAEQFKASMSGVYLVYELANPTTETADTFINPQVVDDFGTEEYTDYAVEAGDRDVAIPVGHNSQYMNNLRAKLEMAPDSPDGDGKYIVQQSNGENAYIPYTADGRLDAIEAKLPAPPSANGTYKLTATVTDGGVTYTWVAG